MDEYLESDLSESGLSGFPGESQTKLPDSHLQSPIRIDIRNYLMKPKEEWPGYLISCLDSCPKSRRALLIASEHTYGKILRCVYEAGPDNILKWVKTHYVESCDVVYRATVSMLSELGLPPPPYRHTPSQQDLILYSQKVVWDDIRILMQNKKAQTAEDMQPKSSPWVTITQLPFGIIEGFACPHYMIFRMLYGESYYVYDYDQVMMIADTISCRVTSLIYNSVLPDDNPGKLPQETLIYCYQELDSLFLEWGNPAYETIGTWESCIMAVMLSKHDRLNKAKEYTQWFEEELQGMGEKGRQIRSVYDHLSQSTLSPSQLAELRGIYRHWGHPTVMEEVGCDKVKKIAKARPIPSLIICYKVVGAIKRQFVISFLSKHGRWPRLGNNEHLQGTAIYPILQSRSRVLNLYAPNVTLDLWGQVRFGKEFEFDYHFDFTDLLEDKSCSVQRSDLRSVYSSAKLGYVPPKAKSSRRVLLEILNRPEIDIKEICDLVQKGLIPEEWKIILVHAKERELKMAPRLFAMMVLEMRLYFCVTESNISKCVFPYYPQQTMILDESELLKRLLTLTNSQDATLKYLAATLGIDFKNWNICWTFLSTYLTFQFLDDLFQTPGLYMYTHKFFESCVISLASHHNPPTSLIDNPRGTPAECETLWYNHLGGLEGLRQKGWTLITIGLLLLVEMETGIKSYIIGQGDNQVCKLIFQIPEGYTSPEAYLLGGQTELTETINKFMTSLTTLSEQLGLKVKLDETWCSADFLVYGKEVIHKGVFLPQGLSRISRLLTDVNEVLPCMFTKISTLQTAGLTCAQKTFCILTSYFVSTIEVLMIIVRDVRRLYKDRRPHRHPLSISMSKTVYEQCLTMGFKEFLINLNTDVASCPVLPLIAFLYRGHPDPLTAYLTNLSMNMKHSSLARKIYWYLILKQYKVGTGDPELLISNPCALNLELPKSVSQHIRQTVENALITVTKNRPLKQIFHKNSRTEDKALFKYLISCDPCHPRVIHEVFRQTVTGARLCFISKFSNTRTTQGLMPDPPQGLISFLFEIDLKLVLFWFRLYKKIMSVTIPHQLCFVCPTRLAQNLRDDTWAVTLDGRPIEGVTIPHPAHQFESDSTADALDGFLKSCKKSNCESILFKQNRSTKHDLLLTRGPYPAYVGSRTREKVSGKMYQIPVSSRPLESAERLVQINEWVINPDSDLYRFIEELATARTDLDLDMLYLITSKISGGSVVHRLNDHVTRRGTAHSFRPNITTHIYLSTDSLGRFSRGLDNYNMHFQGAIHLGFTLYQMYVASETDSIPECIVLRYSGHCCEEKLEDFFISNTETSPKVPNLKTNPLIFTQIHDAPRQMSPGTSKIIRLTAESTPEQAVASLTLMKCTAGLGVVQIGATESANPVISSISLAEVNRIGIKGILNELAKYLFLFLPSDEAHATEVLHAIHPTVFCDLAKLCLVKESYKDFCDDDFVMPSAEVYTNELVMCSMIKRYLSYRIAIFYDRGYELAHVFSRLVFFPSATVGIWKILHMWGRQIEMITRGGMRIKHLFKYIETSAHTTANILHERDLLNFCSKVVGEYGESGLSVIQHHCPLQLASIPPEVVARNCRKPSYIRPPDTLKGTTRDFLGRKVQSTLKTQSQPIFLEKTNYQYCFKLGLRSSQCMEKSCGLTPCIDQRLQKIRADQAYRLYGHISTTFFKIYEIIENEDIVVTGNVVTLAEGEGSIARMLIKLGARVAFFNTLVDQQHLIMQRATSYMPACLVDLEDHVELTELCALTGGDLTDYSTLVRILDALPTSDTSLVTCDAESSTDLDFKTANRIFLAWLAACLRTGAQNGIFKAFCHNAHLISMFMSGCQSVFVDVKCVVPTFSSNETYEVYIVCKDPSPLTSKDQILNCFFHHRVLVCENESLAYSGAIQMKESRISPLPHQLGENTFLAAMYERARDWGFVDNLSSSLNRLVLHQQIFLSGSVTAWLLKTQNLCYQRMINSLRNVSYSYYGISSTDVELSLISGRTSLSRTLDTLGMALFNCNILLYMLEHECIYTAKAALRVCITTPLEIRQEENLVYTINPNHQEWSSNFLKSIWRVWGHMHLKQVHNCQSGLLNGIKDSDLT